MRIGRGSDVLPTHSVRHTGSLYFPVTRVRPVCFRRVRCIVTRLPYVQHGGTSAHHRWNSRDTSGHCRHARRTVIGFCFLPIAGNPAANLWKKISQAYFDRLTRKSRNLLRQVTLLSVASASRKLPSLLYRRYIARPDVPVSFSLGWADIFLRHRFLRGTIRRRRRISRLQRPPSAFEGIGREVISWIEVYLHLLSLDSDWL